MRREEWVTVQGPVKEQQPDGISHGGGGGSTNPEWLYGSMGFVGATGSGDFVLGIRQGEIIFVLPHVSILKILGIWWTIQK